MKWRLKIHLAFVNIILSLMFVSCNCSESADEGENNDLTEIVRVDNGYANKDPDGLLRIKKCDKYFADCDKDANNGCETDIRSDRNNCGGCEKVCQKGANTSIVDCIEQSCQIEYCIAGYVDLDKNYENGCEYKCLKTSEKEQAQNKQDDDCDGFIDNICTYAVDSNQYIIASDLKGRTSHLISAVDESYIAVAYQVVLQDATTNLNYAIIDSQNRILASKNLKNLPSGTEIGGISVQINKNDVVFFWSENQNGTSRILYEALNINGAILYPEKVIYESNNTIENIISTAKGSDIYLSFETVENNKKSIVMLSLDNNNLDIKFKRIVSTVDVDCYGHNVYFLNDSAYVSYWEMRDNKNELVVMKNDLISFKKERYPIYSTELDSGGTAIGYGNGYFTLMWEESTSILGSLYIAVLDENMQSLILKKTDFNYDEFGLPVIVYNGNIFGNTFLAVKNNKNYILFADFDISGTKIQELIISPISIVNKPYISSKGDDYLVFFSDINSKLDYFLSMKRVYCIKN